MVLKCSHHHSSQSTCCLRELKEETGGKMIMMMMMHMGQEEQDVTGSYRLSVPMHRTKGVFTVLILRHPVAG
uniref:Uncharacterized protein n=1 Tax=Onchocerca volvulus TaxID=6282 RepID=A0A8R1Y770_ONCVO